jgi:hypothetical protein
MRARIVEAIDSLARLGLVSVDRETGNADTMSIILTAEGMKSLRT